MTSEEAAWLARQDELEAMATHRIIVEVPTWHLHPVLEPLYKPLLD